MASESVTTEGTTEFFNGWCSSYGLGEGEFTFGLWVEHAGQIEEFHTIDIRSLPDRSDLLKRMPPAWRERFLREAEDAKAGVSP